VGKKNTGEKKADQIRKANIEKNAQVEEAAEKHWGLIRTHVMLGEVVKGVVKGFHSKAKANEAVCKAVGEAYGRDVRGCYKQAVKSKTGNIAKSDDSTFFPDDWDEDLIKQVVVSALQSLLKGVKDVSTAKMSGTGVSNVKAADETVIDMQIEFKECTAFPVLGNPAKE
jgi:hypothetical protein